jgi:hypothetical protein
MIYKEINDLGLVCRRISIACCFSSKLPTLSTTNGGAAGGIHPDHAVKARAQMHRDLGPDRSANHDPGNRVRS